MFQQEASKIDYLSKVFSGLDIEKKDNILDMARSLLHLQENAIDSNQENWSLIAENTPPSQMAGSTKITRI